MPRAHHLTSAATNCFYLAVSWYFTAVTQHHFAYACNHSLSEARSILWKFVGKHNGLIILNWLNDLVSFPVLVEKTHPSETQDQDRVQNNLVQDQVLNIQVWVQVLSFIFCGDNFTL